MSKQPPATDERPVGAPKRRATSGAILVGGGALRMGGVPKGLILLEGQPLLRWLIERLTPLVDELLLIGGDPAAYGSFGLPLVPDETPGQGPLGGLSTALGACRHEQVLCLACDLPRVHGETLRLLRDVAPGADAVVPRTSRGLEPLCARYARRHRPLARQLLQQGRRRITALLAELEGTVYLNAAELPGGEEQFLNLNRPDDVAAIGAQLPGGLSRRSGG